MCSGMSERCKVREPSENRLTALRSGTFPQLPATARGYVRSPNVDHQPVGHDKHSFVHRPWLQDFKEASFAALTMSARSIV